MSSEIFVGYFDTEEKVLAATEEARERGWRIHDVYTPYAVHGMDRAMGLAPSFLTWVCFAAGLLGLTCAVTFQYWVSAVSWPLNIGGKPYGSWVAWVPVSFELTVLFAGLITPSALFAVGRLRPGKKARALPGVTDDRFALALQVAGTRFDMPVIEKFMNAHGAVSMGFTEAP